MSEPDKTWITAALIFLGSGSGGLVRYILGSAIQNWSSSVFPWGTLIVNVTGCLVMGYLVTLWTDPGSVRQEVRAAVLVGFLGGYTTFSSFGRDTLTLVQQKSWLPALGYVLGSLVLSLMAVFLGAYCGKSQWR